MVKVIDLFAGCGGLSLGAARAGLHPTLAIELDARAAASHSLNFPGCRTERWDLSSTNPSALREVVGEEIDLIIGGPPCQGFSVIGRNKIDDPRNDLLSRFFEFVLQLKPRAFFLENVPGLLSNSNRPKLESALTRVRQRYEVVEPCVLNAYETGAATVRKRVVVAGYDKNQVDPFRFCDVVSCAPSGASVYEAFSGLPEPTAFDFQRTEKSNSEYVQRINRVVEGVGDPDLLARFNNGCVSGFVETLHNPNVLSRFDATNVGETDKKSRLPRLDPALPAKTLRAGTGPERGSYQSARPIHPTSPRVISVREAARIQGFPDWFFFDTTKWHSHRMIGNSVCPLFAEEVLRPIAVALGVDRSNSEADQQAVALKQKVVA